MLRREIKDFNLSIDGASGYAVALPFTLYSAMCELGRVERKNTDAGECSITTMRVSATLSADDTFFNGKYSCLRLCGVITPCRVLVNGTLVGETDGLAHKCILDVGAALKKGDNEIEFEFTSPAWDSGILTKVEFLKFDTAIIDSLKVTQHSDGECAVLDLELDCYGNPDGYRAVATLISGAGQIYYGGFNRGKASVTVRDPLYWWPSKMGVQNVYKLSVNLYGDMEVEDGIELKIGLRTLTPSLEPSLLEINGTKMLPMGAVYIPDRICLPTESKRRSAAFVTSAAMAGFNTLVIPVGCRLPDNDFLDLCDVHGITVLCEINDLDAPTLAAIADIAHHPSLAPLELVGLSHKTAEIKALLLENAPAVSYSFTDKSAEYFGETSIPCDKTLFAAIAEEDRNPLSDAVELNSDGAARSMIASASERYPYAWSFSDFSYLTRLAQAENCKNDILERRMAFGEAGRAVFSGLSTKSLISDSALDPNASWKALQYYAARFFTPVAVLAKVCGTRVSFSASNSGKAAAFGNLEYRIIDSSNTLIHKESIDVDIAEHSAKELFTVDLAEQIEGHECDRYLEYILTEGSHMLCRGTLLFVAPKRFKLKDPEIKYELTGTDKRFSLTLSAEAFATGVEIVFDGVDAIISDNYFDLTSSAPLKIGVSLNNPAENLKSLKKALRIRTLYEVGKKE